MHLGVDLGQITGEGKDCDEINRLYTREKRLAKERSKKEHRQRSAANVKRLEPFYQNCQTGSPGGSGGAVDPLPGPSDGAFVPSNLISSGALTASGTVTSAQGLNYGRIGGIALAGIVAVGGLIWFLGRGK